MKHGCKWLPCLVIPMLVYLRVFFLENVSLPLLLSCWTLSETTALLWDSGFCTSLQLTRIDADRTLCRTCGRQECKSQFCPLPLCLALVASGSIQTTSTYSCFWGEDWLVSLSTLEIEPWKPFVTCRCVYHPEGQRGGVIMSSDVAHPGPLYGTGQLSPPPFSLAFCHWSPQAARWHFEYSVWRLLQ